MLRRDTYILPCCAKQREESKWLVSWFCCFLTVRHSQAKRRKVSHKCSNMSYLATEKSDENVCENTGKYKHRSEIIYTEASLRSQLKYTNSCSHHSI